MNKKPRLIDELVKEKPASTIPLEKPTPPPPLTTQVCHANRKFWEQQSNELFADYMYGVNAGLYGDVSKPDIKLFFKRLSKGLSDIITNEYRKNNVPKDSINNHLKILDSILMIIANEVEKDHESGILKEHNFLSVVAGLTGFLSTYVEKVIFTYIQRSIEAKRIHYEDTQIYQ
jgi:hypothetical protein